MSSEGSVKFLISQTFIFLSLPALKSWLPSKEKSTDQTSSVWPDNVESSDQFSVDQSLMFWSALDEASSSPLGEKVNLETKP